MAGSTFLTLACGESYGSCYWKGGFQILLSHTGETLDAVFSSSGTQVAALAEGFWWVSCEQLMFLYCIGTAGI